MEGRQSARRRKAPPHHRSHQSALHASIERFSADPDALPSKDRVIDTQLPREEDQWFPRRPHRNGLVRLFCLPHAGGGAAIFQSWPNLLSSEIEVCAIQLPGPENRLRESPSTSFAALSNKL